MNTQDIQTETLYRICWRVGSSEEVGRSPGTFSLEIAELWVSSLNADQDNRRLGLVHWLEEDTKGKAPGGGKGDGAGTGGGMWL